MIKISKKLLEDFKNLKIRKKDIAKIYEKDESKLFELEVEGVVNFLPSDTLNIATKFINNQITPEWMHEWIDIIVFSDWYKTPDIDDDIIEAMADVNLFLDDEGDECLEFSIEDLKEKIEKLKRIYKEKTGETLL